MKIKRVFILVTLLLAVTYSYGQSKFTYQSVPNDPLHARIYTLPNGLKVYLTVNKLKPRIQTYIAVHVGGKNDPAETTGLSHYLEHLMFKGTSHFGTSNYTAEKPLLDKIRQLYEVYRHTTDSLQRKAIYHQIDSISYEASKYSIPNEYDKMMTSIGSSGTNAYTSEDCTVYQENIPNNEIENWAKVQADRFNDAVIRGFHTELEAVYEEYNISLSNDSEKSYDAMNASLFPNHPYGKQTVIGTQEHLKNPSIINIDNHYHTYYVPNNMAICMSGDFNPDNTIAIIAKYFGILRPNPNLPKLHFEPEKEIQQPIVKKVVGLETPQIALAWRFPAEHSLATDTLQVLSMILYNGQAGLIDEDIVQKQKLVSCYAYPNTMGDYSALFLAGTPKEGQTLDQVRAILLEEINKLKHGDFSESLLKGALNNFKLEQMSALEKDERRARIFVNSFTMDIPWEQSVGELNRLAHITKADVVAFANRYFKDNYVVVYKEKGKDLNQKKIDKPIISPILTNRDKSSDFLREIQNSQVKPIEPVFLDYNRDLSKALAKKGIQVLYKKNTLNDIFSVEYLMERGRNNDKYMPLAFQYLDYLGTPKMSSPEIHKQLFNLGCSFYTGAQDDESYIYLYGLRENMKKAMALIEDLLAHAVVDKTAYTKLTENNIKSRADDKLEQRTNFRRLTSYVLYDGKNLQTVVSNDEMKKVDPQVLVDKIHKFLDYQHRILYYGPEELSNVLTTINSIHHTPKVLKALPAAIEYNYADVKDNKVYIAPYDAKNVYMAMIASTKENTYRPELSPGVTLYNEYFGGSMNSIVFQEMRESRALAYSAWAEYITPYRKNQSYAMEATIITQNDKIKDAMSAFLQILNNVPIAQRNFDLCKQGVLSRIRTARTTGMNVIYSYLNAEKLGLTYDMNKVVFDKIRNMTIQDVLKFQQKYVKDAKYHTAILGDEKDLKMNEIAKYGGTIIRLSQKDIFGY